MEKYISKGKTIIFCLFSLSFLCFACKDDADVKPATPVISAAIEGYSAENVKITTEGSVILLQLPSYNKDYLPTDLTELKVTFTVKYAYLKGYDNGSVNDFSKPVTLQILNSFYETVAYTVKTSVYVPEAPDFAIAGISITGITLDANDISISGQNIVLNVPTLTDAFAATSYTALPVKFDVTYGIPSGFENGAAQDYSGVNGKNVAFKDLSGNTLTYNVKVQPVYRDKGPGIDPILPYSAINLNWTAVSTTLPTGLKLYKVDDFKPGSTSNKTAGYYAELDLGTSSQAKLGVAYTSSGATQNIKNFYTGASNPKPTIITNAGFFGGNTSYSLIVDNSAIKFSNIATISRTYNGASTPYYATRSAFGIMSNGSVEINWIYNSGGKTYAFDTPVRNAMGEVPLPSPMDNAFASIRKEWNPVTAIGGAPILVKDGQIVCTQTAEICDQFQGNRSRTAIGVTADNKIILLVLDETPTPVTGWSLSDLAMIMKTIGCKDAINLDGGGSSAMLLNGIIQTKPSDTASEGDSRAIPTVVTITQK